MRHGKKYKILALQASVDHGKKKDPKQKEESKDDHEEMTRINMGLQIQQT